MTAQLILASQSPRRLELLNQIGVVPDNIIAANIDETPQKQELPKAYVERIAKEKICAIYEKQEENFVLTADTIVAVGRRILGKAKDEKEAEAMLKLLSGRSHRVYTSICLYSPMTKKIHQKTKETRVSFYHLNPYDIQLYIRSNQWRGKAGAYGIQDYAGRFVRQIMGSYPNVMGLPIDLCYNLLKGTGFQMPENFYDT